MPNGDEPNNASEEQENDKLTGYDTDDLMLDTVGKYVTTPIGGTTVLSIDDHIPV